MSEKPSEEKNPMRQVIISLAVFVGVAVAAYFIATWVFSLF
ncbi:hypothetical protein [Luteirhabdus pelagi]|nr:hypothetical protein [Luteirhabdus pelagi]